MRRHPHAVPSTMSVAELVDHHLFSHPQAAFPVETSDGRIVGLVIRSQVCDLAPDRYGYVPVAAVAVPRDDVPTASPDDLLTAALQRLDRQGRDPTGGRMLVFQDGHLVGLVLPSDVDGIVEARTQEVRT